MAGPVPLLKSLTKGSYQKNMLLRGRWHFFKFHEHLSQFSFTYCKKNLKLTQFSRKYRVIIGTSNCFLLKISRAELSLMFNLSTNSILAATWSHSNGVNFFTETVSFVGLTKQFHYVSEFRVNVLIQINSCSSCLGTTWM